MRYEFPTDITLDEVRAAIANHNARLDVKAFIEADRDDHVIFNYLLAFPGSFPAPITDDTALNREYAILRECRGLVFHKNGRLVARRYQKFFNLNEKPETQADAIDWSIPHRILSKLDGSMITPLYFGEMDDISPEALRWGTKMGVTDVAGTVEEWVAREENSHYARWAVMSMRSGYTPIFEWCSRKQRIVIDYPTDDLVLTAIRNNQTGEYLPYEALQAAERSRISIVRALPGSVENLEKFMAEAYDLKGEEGYVIRFDDGHMLKIKGMEYCQFHSAKDGLTFEKDVLALIFADNIDDVKALLNSDDRACLDGYQGAVEAALAATAHRLGTLVKTAKDTLGDDKKAFATQYIRGLTLAEHESGMLFSIFDGADAEAVVRRLVSKYTATSTRVDSVRHLLGGVRWDDYRYPIMEE